ncbi:MAG: SCO family protein [Vallitaleaceae bacterium]|nr:SCO family protein [Vallitaleaceae bacterium]
MKSKNDMAFGGSLPHFSFTNQYNETITEQDVRNKYIISAFFFTSCPNICPKMATQMQRIQNIIIDKPHFIILYHSINPEKDTPDVLFNYAGKLKARKGIWQILTGEEAEIKKMADFYLIRAGTGSSDELLHDGLFVITDPSAKKIGFYNGTDGVSINQMIKEIKKM